MEVASVPVGSRVRVSVGRGSAIGLVLEHADSSAFNPTRLKPVAELLDQTPLLAPELLALLRWTASYYHHPIGEVVMAALPAALRDGASARALQQLAQTWLSAVDRCRLEGHCGAHRPRSRRSSRCSGA